MLQKQFLRVVAGILLAGALGACNLGKSPEPTPDVNALYTAAASTLISQMNDQQTQTAEAVSPTPLLSPTPLASFTPLPTFPVVSGLTPFGTPFTIGTPGAGVTPLATSAGPVVNGFAVGCNNSVLLSETVPDGTTMSAQHDFDKVWSLQNTGTCSWSIGYVFAFKGGDQLGGTDVKIETDAETTAPGHSNAFKVHLFAPKAAGTYQGYWQMKTDTGTWFGARVWFKIIVQ